MNVSRITYVPVERMVLGAGCGITFLPVVNNADNHTRASKNSRRSDPRSFNFTKPLTNRKIGS